MSNYFNAAKAINAAQARETANAGFLITIAGTAFTAAICGAALAICYAMPIRAPAESYDLVQYHGTESDIVDYGLSFDDCLSVMLQARGETVSCVAR